MVFGFLKSEKITASISVDRPGMPYYAGETIHAVVNLNAETAVKVREVFAGLVLWERYQYQERDDEGDTSTSWAAAEDFVVKETLLGEGTIPAGFRESYKLDLRIPLDTVPPYTGKIVQNRWLVRVNVDRPMKKDISEEVDIPLIVPPMAEQTQGGEYGSPSHPDDADIKFAVARLDWIEGEQVAGKLIVRPRKNFGSTGVRLELVRREHVPRAMGNTHSVTEGKVQLAGGTDFRAGIPAEFQFALSIPRQGCPSRRTGRSSVTWTLRAAITRRLAKDFTAEQEVWVYNGRPPA
jgi:hypothetical protein